MAEHVGFVERPLLKLPNFFRSSVLRARTNFDSSPAATVVTSI
jgi:hypothetical protein